jgi:hypothetical protein
MNSGFFATWLLAAALTTASGLAVAATRDERPMRCPGNDRPLPRSNGEAAAETLVPPGFRGMLLCRYRGVSPTPDLAGTLAVSRRIKEEATVKRVAREFNALPPIPPGSGVAACPSDNGSTVIAFFHYARAPAVPVTANLRGCRSVTNGQAVRTALTAPGERLLRHIENLIPERERKASGRIYVAICGTTGYLQHKPRYWSNGCTGGSLNVRGVRWRSWRRRTAYGIGTAWLRVDVDLPLYKTPARIRLYAVRRCISPQGLEQRYYSRARVAKYYGPGNPFGFSVGWQRERFRTLPGGGCRLVRR